MGLQYRRLTCLVSLHGVWAGTATFRTAATYFARLLALGHEGTLRALTGEEQTAKKMLRSDVYADPWGLKELRGQSDNDSNEQSDHGSNERRRNRLKKEHLQPLVFEIGHPRYRGGGVYSRGDGVAAYACLIGETRRREARLRRQGKRPTGCTLRRGRSTRRRWRSSPGRRSQSP